jgi:hypothetical protein
MIKKKKGGTQLITLVVRDSIKKLYIVGGTDMRFKTGFSP